MLMKCRECKTIYDDSEKYCPYCFTRTKEIVRYRSSMDKGRVEGSEIIKRKNMKYNYQKRATTKYKTKQSNHVVVTIMILILVFLIISVIGSVLLIVVGE